MVISSEGIAFIKQHEGLYLHAYDDGVGVMTIGYGHTKNVKRGDVITLQQAEEYLRGDLKEFEEAVNGLNLNLKQNQYDSLVSFLFNVGVGALSTEYKIGRHLRNNELSEVPKDMLAWCNAGGYYMQGLYNRRVDEAKLFGQHPISVSTDTTILKEGDYSEVSKTFKNGSTEETIWTSNEHVNKVGTLNKYEECKCLGVHNGHAIVQFVGSHNYDKVGFTTCTVAERNGIIVPLN